MPSASCLVLLFIVPFSADSFDSSNSNSECSAYTMTLGIINPTNIIDNIVICLLFLRRLVNIKYYIINRHCILVFDTNYIKLPLGIIYLYYIVYFILHNMSLMTKNITTFSLLGIFLA